MVEYGVSKKMLETALRVGQRFWDPLNRSIVRVLEEGFASGRSLGVAQDPISQVIKTVMKGKDVIRRRFIPF